MNEKASQEPIKTAMYADSQSAQPKRARKVKRAPPGARCVRCGSEELVGIPSFSAGSGVAGRPFAEDVICTRCGEIAPAAF